MKPDIQANMENRIEEIRTQNTIFDDVITTVETTLSIEMLPQTAGMYSGTDGTWSITIVLDESLTDGVITVGLNQTIDQGDARIASMTIHSTRQIHESINNVSNIVDHRYVVDLFAAIFEAVKQTNSSGQDDAS